MSRDLSIIDHTERLAVIVDDYILKGEVNPTTIAKATGLKRVEVVNYIAEWRAISANNEWVKERAQQSLYDFDRGYDKVIKELWNVYEDAESTRDQNSIMANIAKVMKDRADVLQRAGLYDDAALGDEVAKLEEQVEELKKLLAKVAERFPDTRVFLMEEIGKIFGVAQRTDAP